MTKQNEIGDMVSYGQVTYEEAENWYNNKERILQLHPELNGADDFLDWFYQQEDVYSQLDSERLQAIFLRYNEVCIARGGIGYK